jgi:hypothetical protein
MKKIQNNLKKNKEGKEANIVSFPNLIEPSGFGRFN